MKRRQAAIEANAENSEVANVDNANIAQDAEKAFSEALNALDTNI